MITPWAFGHFLLRSQGVFALPVGKDSTQRSVQFSGAGSDFAYGSPEFAVTQKFGSHTPLWYCILKEAQDRNGPSGKHLGKLGRRILTECFVAFLEASPQSIFDSGFTPSAGRFGCTTDGEYNLAMLVRYASAQ